MRVFHAFLLAAMAISMLMPGITATIPSEDLSLLDLSMSMPSDLPEGTSDGMSAKAVADLHAAAGSVADDAIAEAKRQSMLMETDSILATGSRKWDDSVPEVHLKTATRPEEVLTTELETVEHLDHARASLTKEDLTAPRALMAAFPHSSPAILGEDHSFIQHEAQQTQQTQQTQQAAQQVEIVVAHETDAGHAGAAETETEAATLTEAEIAAGVVTMSDLQQMMELEGYSQQEIDSYMENLGQQTVDAETETEGEATAETETETEGEAETEGETETETETEGEESTEAEAETETETETEQETEGEQEVEGEATQETETEAATETEATEGTHAVQATEEELAAYAQDAAESGIPAIELIEIERKAQAEEEARLAAEHEADPSLVEESAEAQFDVEAEFEAVHSSDSESEQEAVMSSDMDAESVAEQEMEGEVETEVPVIANQDEEMVHLRDQPAPAQLTEAIQATVTPIHSRAYNRRHPTLNRLSQRSNRPSGYSLPQATSMMETGSKVQHQQRQRSEGEELDTSKFNPSAVQLGPSKDAYGYVPMTGAEFLHSPQQPASLAQVSMQLQNQGGSWLPPPIESQQEPNYVVGMGGLMPNRNAGPYQGQYGMAAVAQPIAEQPTW